MSSLNKNSLSNIIFAYFPIGMLFLSVFNDSASLYFYNEYIKKIW